MNTWYTIKELVEKTNVPHQTIRRYIERHSHHFTMKRKHKGYSLLENSVELIEKIRNLYGKGMNAEEVDEELAASGVPIEYMIEDEKNMITTTGKAFETLQQSMRELREKYEKQEEFNNTLVKQLQNQEEYIKISIEQRDQKLMDSIREQQEMKQLLLEVRETQKEIAATQKEDKNKGWFARLFK